MKLQGKVKAIEYCQLPLQHGEGSHPNYALRLNIEHIPIARLAKEKKLLEKSFFLNIEVVGIHLTTLEGVDTLIKLPLESSPMIWFRLYGLNYETDLIYASIILKRVNNLRFIKFQQVAPYPYKNPFSRNSGNSGVKGILP